MGRAHVPCRPSASPRPLADRTRTASVAKHVGPVVVLLVLPYPLVWLLATSLKPANEVLTSLRLLPSHLEWSNYTTALDGISGVFVTWLRGPMFGAANRASCSAPASPSSPTCSPWA